MRLVVEALREQVFRLVPFHGKVGFAGLFPDFDELVERVTVVAIRLRKEFECLDREALAHHADGIERTVDELALF